MIAIGKLTVRRDRLAIELPEAVYFLYNEGVAKREPAVYYVVEYEPADQFARLIPLSEVESAMAKAREADPIRKSARDCAARARANAAIGRR